MLAILAESALRSLLLGSVVWVGLNLLRIRNPHMHMTSWVMVLVASLSMPLLMHWTTMTITLDPLPVPTPENLWSAKSPLPELPEPLRSSLPSELGMPVANHGENHEGAHVANRDFYVLLLASLNRAVFWFSPFAWWQLLRLAELAEIISDARALEVLEDKLSYAELLLDLVQNVQRAPAGLEMARACTVRARVERILAATTAPAKVGWRKRIWTAVAILPVVVVSAGSIAYTTKPVATPAIDDAQATAVRTPERITFYSFGRASIYTVSREGDDLFGQLSGQRK